MRGRLALRAVEHLQGTKPTPILVKTKVIEKAKKGGVLWRELTEAAI